MWGFFPLPAGIGVIVIVLMILAIPQVGIGLLIGGVAVLLVKIGFGYVTSAVLAILLFIGATGAYCIHKEKEENEIEEKYQRKLHELDKEFRDIRDFNYSKELDKAIKEENLEAFERLDERLGRYAEWKKRRDEIKAEFYR